MEELNPLSFHIPSLSPLLLWENFDHLQSTAKAINAREEKMENEGTEKDAMVNECSDNGATTKKEDGAIYKSDFSLIDIYFYCSCLCLL